MDGGRKGEADLSVSRLSVDTDSGLGNRCNMPNETCIRCPQCEGKGKVALYSVLRQTLEIIPKTGWVSTMDLHRNFKLFANITGEALANRLVRLEKLKLVKSKILTGKAKLWQRV